jgi:hypothetical protein
MPETISRYGPITNPRRLNVLYTFGLQIEYSV